MSSRDHVNSNVRVLLEQTRNETRCILGPSWCFFTDIHFGPTPCWPALSSGVRYLNMSEFDIEPPRIYRCSLITKRDRECKGHWIDQVARHFLNLIASESRRVAAALAKTKTEQLLQNIQDAFYSCRIALLQAPDQGIFLLLFSAIFSHGFCHGILRQVCWNKQVLNLLTCRCCQNQQTNTNIFHIHKHSSEHCRDGEGST